MCTLRAILVISEGGDIVLSRRYGSVEKLAKQIYGNSYIPVAPDWEFKKLFLEAVSQISTESEPSADSFSHNRSKCIVKLQEKMWPVVYLHKIGTFIVAVPLVEGIISHSHSNTLLESFSVDHIENLPLTDMPFIVSTLSFLESFVQFVEPCAPRFELEKVAELQTLLSRMVQFGKPIETNLYNVISLNKTQFPATDISEKRPAWKPTVSMPLTVPGAKFVNRFDMQLIESISAVQYDHSDIVNDTWQVSGKIVSRVDLDIHPEITVQLSRASSGPDICDARFHPCVSNTSWTTYPLTTSFYPPLGHFNLCNYIVSNLPKLPIRGFYQLRETNIPNQVKILVQLKLAEYVNNSFEYCDVEIPFPTRREIVSFDLVPSSGSIVIHPKKKNSLIWSLGTRISGRNLEVALPGTVQFDISGNKNPATIASTSSITPALPNSNEDPFCVIPNAFIELRFKILDTSLSGLTLDQKHVLMAPKPSQLKNINLERHVVSDKYIIWNSQGDVKYCLDPELSPSSSS